MLTESVYDWSLAMIVCASTYCSYFYYISWKTGILAKFGRSANSWDTLGKLTLLALMPAMFTFAMAMSAWDYPPSTWVPPIFVCMWLLIGLSSMRTVGQRIKVE